MQIKIFTIPIHDGELLNEELNRFLRSKRVLQTEIQLVQHGQGTFWTFCIQYLEDNPTKPVSRGRKKVDYKEVLDEASFQRFTEMRQIRRQLAQEEGIPAYAIFTDEEMAELAKLEQRTATSMRKVKGIGPKKMEKFGIHFHTTTDEKS
ncbi:MAG: HRDC domain-containing protein [Bacteroidota bacterium]